MKRLFFLLTFLLAAFGINAATQPFNPTTYLYRKGDFLTSDGTNLFRLAGTNFADGQTLVKDSTYPGGWKAGTGGGGGSSGTATNLVSGANLTNVTEWGTTSLGSNWVRLIGANNRLTFSNTSTHEWFTDQTNGEFSVHGPLNILTNNQPSDVTNGAAAWWNNGGILTLRTSTPGSTNWNDVLTVDTNGGFAVSVADARSDYSAQNISFTAGSVPTIADAGVAGGFSVHTGHGIENSAGDFTLTTGASTNSTSGRVLITTGSSVDGSGGNYVLTSGNSGESDAGSFIITTGSSTNGNAGDFRVTTGRSTNGANGKIILTTAELQVSNLNSGKNGAFINNTLATNYGQPFYFTTNAQSGTFWAWISGSGLLYSNTVTKKYFSVSTNGVVTADGSGLTNLTGNASGLTNYQGNFVSALSYTTTNVVIDVGAFTNAANLTLTLLVTNPFTCLLPVTNAIPWQRFRLIVQQGSTLTNTLVYASVSTNTTSTAFGHRPPAFGQFLTLPTNSANSELIIDFQIDNHTNAVHVNETPIAY